MRVGPSAPDDQGRLTLHEGFERHERGLSLEEVRARIAAGQINAYPHPSSRRVRDIIRENTLTPFNAVLGGFS